MENAACPRLSAFAVPRRAGGWLLLGLVVALAMPAVAQSDRLSIPLGEPVERLTAASDSSQHYALYLPTSYDPETPPPVAFLMDPRGRAMTPLRLFQAEAEKRG